MKDFWKGETYAIVKAMKAMGNLPGVIANWKSRVAQWADVNPTNPDAAAVRAWLPHWHERPFYTADELAPIWPALAIAIGFTDRWPAVLKSPRRLEHELDFAGLPHFWMDGKKYYVVERLHFWKKANQEDRKNALHPE